MHTRFGHPSGTKLYEFNARSSPDELDENTHEELERLTARRRICQFTRRASVRFRVAVPDSDMRYNSEVIVDLFSIKGRNALSIMDCATRFSVCKFMPSNRDVKAKDVWRMILSAWVHTYLCFPDVIRHDRGSQFIAEELQAAAAAVGVQCHSAGMEAASAMGIGERIHGPIRRIFEKLSIDHPGLDDDDYILQATVKAFNDGYGSDGLTSTLLLFGAYPKIPLRNSSRHAMPQSARLSIMDAARDYYHELVDAKRLALTVKSNAPTPTWDTLFEFGDGVVVWRYRSRRWEPVTFLYIRVSLIYVRMGSDVKPYPRERVRLAVSGLDYGSEQGPVTLLDIPALASTPADPDVAMEADIAPVTVVARARDADGVASDSVAMVDDGVVRP